MAKVTAGIPGCYTAGMHTMQTPAAYASSAAQSTLEPGLRGVLRVIVIGPIVVYACWPGLAARLGRWYLPIFVASHSGGGTTVRLLAP